MALKQLSLSELLEQGFYRLERGETDSAAACCREALSRKPDLVPGHFLVGLIGLESDQRKTAYQAFRTVTQLDPKHAAGWAHLAKLLMSEGQVRRADGALQQATRYVGSEPIVFDLIGTVYSLMGEYGLASQWFSKAVSEQPNHPPFLLNYANNLIYRGDTEQANQLFEKILSIQPDSPQAHWAMAGSRRATDTAHIDTMRELVERPGRHPRAIAFFQYAIGKELEDLERWSDAFTAFAAGATARRQTVDFDEAAEVEMFDLLTSQYTADRFADLAGHPTAAPIFVLGQPRTGTTLIERIISSHSQVHSAGELQQFGLAVRRLSDYQNPKRFSAELFERALQLDPSKVGGLYLDTTARMRGDTPHFVDKLPQNYLLLPLILAALPNAKIVHLSRQPMDACFASFKQLFADAYLHSYDLQEMGRHHARYWHLMQTWRQRFPERFLDVSYEATAQDFEPAVRRLIDFLELPWEDSCLNFHRQTAAVSTASAVQVRQPIHTRSINRWHRYAPQLQLLLETLIEAGVPLNSVGELATLPTS